MNSNECLLCHNPACTRACGKMEPDRILRSLRFGNEEVVANRIDEHVPCFGCDAPCEDACPIHCSIKEKITSIKPAKEKIEINYDVLKTDFCGIPMENPFMLSSSIVSSTYEMCAKALEAGWGGVCFKTVCLMDIEEASPRYSAIKDYGNSIMGFKNIEQLSEKKLPELLQIFHDLKKNYPDKFLLVSIMGRDEEEWAQLAEVMNDSGADALELNFSCPNMTEGNTGSDVGQVPELVEKYCRVVKEHTKLPFIAKLTPNVTRIEDSAEAAIRGGADGVAAINTIKSFIEVGFEPGGGVYRASIGGYSGPAVRPIALRFIANLSKDEMLEGKHISAMGGAVTWKDCFDFIGLGADSVQITTAVMEFGVRIIDDIKDGAAYFLNKIGIDSIKKIRNIGAGAIVPIDELDRSYIIYPRFIREKCVGCQRCYLSCRDGSHQAINIIDGKPVLNPEKCVGCHLCVLICPMNAIVSSGIKVPKKQ